MKNKLFKPQPNLEERLDQVNERIQRARWRLDWQTREARIPLDIQEDVGVSKLEGDVMLVSRDGALRDKVRNLIHSEGYGCDISERSTSAVGLLKLGKISDDNCRLHATFTRGGCLNMLGGISPMSKLSQLSVMITKGDAL